MKTVRCRRVSVTRIDEENVSEMFSLFSQYYQDVDLQTFRDDLREKNECMILYTPMLTDEHRTSGCVPGRIVGFSTIRRDREPGLFGATYLFSGDTVLDKRCWGHRLLERAFFWTILREKLRAPWRPLYWMLISKGFITYLMMVRNFPSSHPRHDRAMPEPIRRRMDLYYARRYGANYHPDEGLIRFDAGHGAVRGKLAAPKGAMHADPDVAYFVRRNPGYEHGDELACLAQIRARDFALHFATAFRRRRNRRDVVRKRTVAKHPDLGARPAH